MNKFKKFLRSIVCITTIAFGGLAFADTQVITFLDTYDQLVGVTGQSGFFFVRDAGNQSTGQHGDPRVRWGWAMYTWDTSNRSWKMVSKQETTEAEFPDIVYFLTKAQYNADIAPFKASVLTNTSDISRLKVDNVVISNRINSVESDITLVRSDATALSNRVNSAEASVARIDVDVDTLKDEMEGALAGVAKNTANIVVLSNKINTVDGKLDVAIVELKAYTDTTVSDAKVDIITNTAKRVHAVLAQAKAYTDGQVAIEANRADTNMTAHVNTKATEVIESVNTKIGDLGSSATVVAFVGVKKQEAIDSAKSYTDTEVYNLKTNLTDKIQTDDAATLASAKSYADNTTLPAAKTYADGVAEIARTNAIDVAEKYAVAQDATLKSDLEGQITTLSGVVDTKASKTELNTATNSVVEKLTSDIATAKQQAIDKADEKAAQRDATLNVNLKAFATDRAYEAKTNAIDVASKDATSKANTAESNASAYALQITEATSNNVVLIASADATKKADDAEEAAIAAASADASTKTNAVYALSKTYADSVAGTAKSDAIKYTTDKLDAADKAELEAGTTKFATKHNLSEAVAGALVFPLKIKKGDVTYTLDVVDDGSGDITLKITK